MKTLDDMQVAQVEYSDWGKAHDLTSDWNLATHHASFSHREHCVWIFYIGYEGKIQEYATAGFSSTFLNLCRLTASENFKYLCIYK